MTTAETPVVPRPAESRSQPNVLAVVVTHRGREWIRDCLVSLNTQTYKALDVLVVDDSSPDFRQPPHLKRIVKRHLRRRRWGFLRTPRSLGFGGAINWALARARTDAELLLFLHDDAALTPQSVERMVARIMADRQTAVVGPKIVAWDDPDRLEEVGMAIDRLGYPYKGLEDDEIDIGQHDDPAEVFYVTSTCMLMRADLFRQLKGFDARMGAFSEDLDLCWRVRVLGHSVRFEPAAKARHKIALARNERESKFKPQRYYIRRNRLRTVLKNVSTLRALALLPVFILLAFAEMLAFIVLRQPREVLNILRGLGWNLISLPQTIAVRMRVQMNRKVSDRHLRRLMIKESSRVRFYLQAQTDKMEEAWGRRAEIIAERSSSARAFGRRMRGRPLLIMVVALIAFALAFRHFVWSPAVTSGELLPYSGKATSLFRTFFSPWQDIGLGQPGPSSPALIPLGFISLLTFGAAGAAQKLLLLSLGLISFIGAYRLVSDLVDRWGRVVAGVVYVAGSLGYAGVRHGALAALAFGAVAPFALHSLLRLTGWVRPAGWNPGRETAKLAAAAGLSAAFVPGSLVLYLICAIGLALARELLNPGHKAIRSLVAAVVGLVLGWALLLPWSASWWQDGGPMDRLRGDDTWRMFADTFADHGMVSVILGQMPDGPVLFGLALPLFGIMALLLGEGQRRRVAVALWGVVVLIGVMTALFAGGMIRPLVANPIEAGVLPALAFSALAGIAVGGFRLDLPRRGLGLVQGLAITGMAVALFLVAAGLGPAIWGGEWRPEGISASTVDEIRSLLEAEEQNEPSGTFRTLWVGRDWNRGALSAAVPSEDKFVTGPHGRELNDLFEKETPEAEQQLNRAIASIESGSTDRGGSLLGAFNIRFVVLDPGVAEEQWLEQRDLAAVRRGEDYVFLQNTAEPARPGLYLNRPPYVTALDEGTADAVAGATTELIVPVLQESASRYAVESGEEPGVAFLPETSHERWTATADGEELERADGGWGNAFEVSEAFDGSLEMRYTRPGLHLVTLIIVGLAWVVVLGAASSTKRHLPSVRKRS
jgi:GT2 family glycosyltransferase